MIDLIILVGTNPLPCYISAVYLCNYYKEERISNIYFIGSLENPDNKQDKTIDIAERIIKLLDENESEGLKNQNISKNIKELRDVRDKDCVINIINFIKNNSNNNSIELNFTGGTKSMSVFFYDECKYKYKDQFSSSYLDARTHQLILYDEQSYNLSEDLRDLDYLNLSLAEIGYLHNFKVESKFPDSKCKNISAYDFEKLKQYKPALNKFEEYLHNGIIDNFYNPQIGFDAEKFKEKKGRTNSFKEKITDEEKSILINNELIKPIWESIEGVDKVKHLLEFLGGTWLEYWIYDILTSQDKLVEENNILAENIVFYFDNLITPIDGKKIPFQLDICAVYGYQLNVISITTAKDKGTVKLKAFEALHRAHQLGGDESKIIQVSLLNRSNNQDLMDDLFIEVGSLESKFLCLGLEDLTMDKNEIRKIIVEHIKI